MKENEKDLRNAFLGYVFEVRERIVNVPLAAKEAEGNAEVQTGANADLLHRSGHKIKLSPLPLQDIFPPNSFKMKQVPGWLHEAGQQEETHLSQDTNIPWVQPLVVHRSRLWGVGSSGGRFLCLFINWQEKKTKAEHMMQTPPPHTPFHPSFPGGWS